MSVSAKQQVPRGRYEARSTTALSASDEHTTASLDDASRLSTFGSVLSHCNVM